MKGRWICVDDELPEAWREVLCYCAPRTGRGMWKFHVCSRWDWHGEILWSPTPASGRRVRFWTPLPPAPDARLLEVVRLLVKNG